jgi:Ca2+-binding RTX toxin-like protein
MSKVRYFKALANTGYIDDMYSYSDLADQEGSTESHAVFDDDSTGNKILLEGTGFQYSDHLLTAGTISQITFSTGADAKLIRINGLRSDAGTAFDRFEKGDIDGMLSYLLKGADKISGSALADNLNGYGGKDVISGGNGNDYVSGYGGSDTLLGGNGRDILFGYNGNDRLTGGRGSDTFSFYGRTGHDVITDFDAKGGGHRQDYLTTYTGDHFTYERDGLDLLVNFDDGDVVRLLHVKLRDFDPDVDVVLF